MFHVKKSTFCLLHLHDAARPLPCDVVLKDFAYVVAVVVRVCVVYRLSTTLQLGQKLGHLWIGLPGITNNMKVLSKHIEVNRVTLPYLRHKLQQTISWCFIQTYIYFISLYVMGFTLLFYMRVGSSRSRIQTRTDQAYCQGLSFIKCYNQC